MALKLSQIPILEVVRILLFFVFKDDHSATFVADCDMIARIIKADFGESILFWSTWKILVSQATHVAPLNQILLGGGGGGGAWVLHFLNRIVLIEISYGHFANFRVGGHRLRTARLLIWIFGAKLTRLDLLGLGIPVRNYATFYQSFSTRLYYFRSLFHFFWLHLSFPL